MPLGGERLGTAVLELKTDAKKLNRGINQAQAIEATANLSAKTQQGQQKLNTSLANLQTGNARAQELATRKITEAIERIRVA